jgi:hypothetical protein
VERVIILDKKQVCFLSRMIKKKKGEKYSIFLLLKRSIKKYKEKQFKIKYIYLFYFDAIKTEGV